VESFNSNYFSLTPFANWQVSLVLISYIVILILSLYDKNIEENLGRKGEHCGRITI
jgi:hypothetical protein